MKLALIVAAMALTAAPAMGQPHKSQRPRVGQLAAVPFDHGSAQLTAHTDTTLARDLGEVAAWAQENPDGLLVLDAHTDRTGSKKVNKQLSLERAKAVRDQLLLLDVDPNQIVIAAFGESSKSARKVVVWGTRAGMKAIVARSKARGVPVFDAGVLSRADLNPQPGAVATRR